MAVPDSILIEVVTKTELRYFKGTPPRSDDEQLMHVLERHTNSNLGFGTRQISGNSATKSCDEGASGAEVESHAVEAVPAGHPLLCEIIKVSYMPACRWLCCHQAMHALFPLRSEADVKVASYRLV